MESIRKIKTLEPPVVSQNNTVKPPVDNLKPQTVGGKVKILPIVAVVAIIFGSLTGWVAARANAGGASNLSKSGSQSEVKKVDNKEEAGVANDELFPDVAVGTLVEGGKDGEGTHYLDRGTGPSQYVYLTSTFVSLQRFVGKKVEVRGQTLSALKVGWLMDVGRIKVVQ